MADRALSRRAVLTRAFSATAVVAMIPAAIAEAKPSLTNDEVLIAWRSLNDDQRAQMKLLLAVFQMQNAKAA